MDYTKPDPDRAMQEMRAAAARQALAAKRRAHLVEVKSGVRNQLAQSQRERRAILEGLAQLRRGLAASRTQLRARLRQISKNAKAQGEQKNAEAAETKSPDRVNSAKAASG